MIRIPRRRGARNALAAASAVACRGLVLAALAGLPAARAQSLGAADGSFESGLVGMNTSGNVRVVTALGILRPTHGHQAVLLTTAPNAGATPGSAHGATVSLANLTVPAASATLRADVSFLTNEPDPAYTNDTLTIVLRHNATAVEQTLATLDTFALFQPAPWTGYRMQTGLLSIQADVTACAGNADSFTLELRLNDVGDGRVDSAAFVDNLRFAAAGTPVARVNVEYAQTTADQPIWLSGLDSTDDGTIVEYRWDFGDGRLATGPAGNIPYPADGIYQGTLTVTDNDGNTDTDTFIVQVGPVNHAPEIVSAPVVAVALGMTYRYSVLVDDPDVQFGDTLTFALDAGPAGMALDPLTGAVTWLVPPTASGEYTVTVRVLDSLGLTNTQTYALAVVVPKPFIVVTDDGGSIYVAESNGDGTWSAFRQVSRMATYLRGVASADFNNDGTLDFVTGAPAAAADTYYLFLNDGTNQFRNLGVVGSGAPGSGYLEDMAAGDFNHDGNMDFIANTHGRATHVALGNGRGGFTITTLTLGATSTYGRGLDAADVNHDGHPDFVRGLYSSGQTTTYIGNGTGTFTAAASPLDPGSEPYGVVAADFNRDGHLDIIAGEGSGGAVYFYAGTGAGTYAAGVLAFDLNQTCSLDNFDFNSDGNQDLVVAVPGEKKVSFYPGNGNGTFGSAVLINATVTGSACYGLSAPPTLGSASDPVARITPPLTAVPSATPVNLSASTSTDAGTLVSYAWDFGDGTTGSGIDVVHSYPAGEGRYLVRLTVTDTAGYRAIATAVVRMLGALPDAVAGGPYTFGEQYATWGTYTVPLDGSGSTDDGVTPLEFAWDPHSAFTEGFDFFMPNPYVWLTSTDVWVAGGEGVVRGNRSWGQRYLVSKLTFPRVPDDRFRARVRVTRTSAAAVPNLAWGLEPDDAATHNTAAFLYGISFNSGKLYVYEDGTQRTTPFTFLENTDYDLRLDVKPWGAAYYYRRTGTTDWSPLYDSSLSAASPFRLSLTVYEGTVYLDDVALSGHPLEGARPMAVYYRGGTYPLGLTVTDGVLQRATDSTTVSLIGNALPVARPGGPYAPEESRAACNQWTVPFDGTASSDDVGLAWYQWDFGDGSQDSGPAPTHTYAAGGTYTVTLTVYDHALQAHTATTTVTTTPGTPPVAAPGGPYAFDERTASAGQWTATFDGSGSRDDNGICDYAWTFGDGASGSGPAPTHTYAAPGLYTVTLTVRDHAFQSHTAATTAHILQNDPPQADPGGPYYIDEHQAWQGEWTARFDGSGSTDDVGLWTYAWNFGDGGTGSGMSPVHRYTARGAYIVSLTVTDHGQQTHTLTTQITVAANALPTADAGADQTVEVGMPATLDARDSSDDFGLMSTTWSLPMQPFHVDFDKGALAYDLGVWGTAVHASFADGQAVLTAGTTYNNSRLLTRYNFPRRAGDVYTVTFTPRGTSASRSLVCGLQDSQNSTGPGSLEYGVALNSSHQITAYASGASRGVVGTYSDDVTYDLRLELTAGGARLLWKPASETAWALLYTATTLVSGPFRLVAATNAGEWGVTAMSGPPAADIGPYPVRQTQATFDTPGAYTATLTVQDHALQTSTDTVSIRVVNGNAPIADAGGPYLTNEDIPTRLNARSSVDDYGIQWYDWGFGDGQSQLTRNPWIDHRYATAGSYTVTLTVTDFAGQTSTDTAAVTVSPAPVVACVPWQFVADDEVPHDTWSGKEAVLKAVAWSKHLPLTYVWDFGDGSATATGTVATPRAIEARHTYTGVDGQPCVATLTVTDADGRSATDRYLLRIRQRTIDSDINIAIDSGLWWLHKRQTLEAFAVGTYGNAAIDLGYWLRGTNASGYRAAPTASAVQAFLVNGHLEHRDVRADPYVETVTRALHYLPHFLNPTGIAPQTHGDPDTNRNGLGLTIRTGTGYSPGSQQSYEMGMIMDALVASGSPLTCAVTGPLGVVHRSTRDLLTDCVDACAWGQDDATGLAGGGWRYGSNGGSDNSCSQWPAIGMLAAEDVLKLDVPYWVKRRLNAWLDHTYDGTGFGYSAPGNTRNLTPSGMVQIAFIGGKASDDSTTPFDDRDPRWTSAENYIANNWNSTSYWVPGSHYSTYGFFAFAKAMRVARPRPLERLAATGLDWYKDDTVGMARRVMAKQAADGGWPEDSYSSSIDPDLTTAWSVLILSPTLFVQPPVPDAGEDRVWGVNEPITLDGSRSYHSDPFRRLVLYEWDTNGDGTYDTSSATDPTVTVTYAAADYPSLPVSIAARLRVTDNNDPAITAVDTVYLIIAVPPHPPLAAAGGPYTARTAALVTLDGAGSHDIDPTDLITAWDWDLDGDGLYDDATGPTPQVSFAAAGTYNVGLRVTDNAVMNDLNHDGFPDVAERLADFAFATVTVYDNRAPVLDPAALLILGTISEDDTNPPGDLIDAALAVDPLLPDPLTDPDVGALEGVAVVAVSGDGTWQWQPEGGAWTGLGAVSEGAALLLPDSAGLRFLPRLARNHGQTATLAFRAWDQTSGTAGAIADTSSNGGTTAFSLALATATLAVTDVNDPPTIAGLPPTAVNEGSPYAFTPTASDPDPGDALLFNIANRPPWAAFAAADGTLTGTPEQADAGVYTGIAIRVTDLAGASASLPPFDLTVLATGCQPHQADQNGDWIIQLSPELTRLIQFYNRGGYHCQPDTEDGYAPGPPGIDPADTAGRPHQADQNADWIIQLSPELTRLIQFYNSGTYHCEGGTEDGYAPEAEHR